MNAVARTLVTIAVVAALVAALAQARQPTHPAQAAPSASHETVQVDIVSESLPNLSVTVGDRVRWTNLDDDIHTSTSGQNGAFTVIDGVSWRSGILNNGDSFSFTFNKVGSFAYTCEVHPFTMNATVRVKPPPTPAPPTPTPSPRQPPGQRPPHYRRGPRNRRPRHFRSSSWSPRSRSHPRPAKVAA